MKKPNHRGTRVPFIKKPNRLLRCVASARRRDLENLVHADQQPNITMVRHKHWRTLRPSKSPNEKADPAKLIRLKE